MGDLKRLDELLLDYMRSLKLQPADMETHSLLTRDVIERLRGAYHSGEMRQTGITMTWAKHFEPTH